MHKYKDFLVGDFLDDPDFIRWMTEALPEDDRFWREFVKSYPSKKNDIQEARLLFRLLHSQERKLTLADQYELLNKIQREAKSSAKQVLFKALKYVAILALVFFSGSITHYYYGKESAPPFENTLDINKNAFEETAFEDAGQAMIILSDGTQIPLNRQMSKISYSSNGKDIIVNNDTLCQPASMNDNALNKVVVSYGKKSVIELSDGTKVWLNAGSQILFPVTFKEDVRKIILEGEAFFDVTKNQKKPFIVVTPDQSVRVLGTRFNISAYSEDKVTQTVLEEGKVQVKFFGKGFLNREYVVEMEPSQMVEFDKTSRAIRKVRIDATKYTSWKEDVFEFDRANLASAVKQIERFYNIRVNMADPSIGKYKLSGKLDLRDEPEEVLNIIKLTVPIVWKKNSSTDFELIKKEEK